MCVREREGEGEREEASSDCGGEVFGCQGDRPQCGSEDSKMRRAMRICARIGHGPLIKMKVRAHK